MTIGLLSCVFSLPALAQNSHAPLKDAWAGVWNAEHTLFTLRVVRYEEAFVVEPVESLGMVWVTRNGVINGDNATVEVEYQGVVGRVLIQLIDANTAVARAMSCQPDYHVICALVKNQQARFLKSDSISE